MRRLGGPPARLPAVRHPTPTILSHLVTDNVRKENVTENRPLGINESLAETLAADERIRREADVLVPLYDPGVFRRHPNGIGAWPLGQGNDRGRSRAHR
jgi:hypothetical protein